MERVRSRLKNKRPSISWVLWSVRHNKISTKDASYGLFPYTKLTTGYVKLIKMTDSTLRCYLERRSQAKDDQKVLDEIESTTRDVLKMIWPKAR